MSDRPLRRSLHVVHTLSGTPLVTVEQDIWSPPTDVYETEKEIIVKVDIAGVEENDMEVTVENGLLIVRGFRSDCSAFSKSAVHRMEIFCGAFETHAHLPHAVDTDGEIDCIYHNGMLTVTLRKESAHKVQITTEREK
jgi:HSP20 family protein